MFVHKGVPNRTGKDSVPMPLFTYEQDMPQVHMSYSTCGQDKVLMALFTHGHDKVAMATNM